MSEVKHIVHEDGMHLALQKASLESLKFYHYKELKMKHRRRLEKMTRALEPPTSSNQIEE